MTKQTFRDILKTKEFVVTAEIGPPKGTDISQMKHHIDLLKDKVDGINVTDNQSSVMRYPSVGGCLEILQKGGLPVLQMTCRDRNRMALESELLFAYEIGVRTVLCLTGDAVDVGDHKDAKPVFDLDSVQLIKMVRTLESGKDLAGNQLQGAVEYCVGATVTPEADPIEPQLMKFKKKVTVGAEFFQTQAIYDLNNFREFMDYARNIPVKILAGIHFLVWLISSIKFCGTNMPGTFSFIYFAIPADTRRTMPAKILTLNFLA